MFFKKVMERVIKRFLLHNNRENEEIRESDFDELKQDVQMIRYEMLNNLKHNKEYALKYMSLIHNGVSVLGDYLLQSTGNSDIALNFKHFQLYEENFAEQINNLNLMYNNNNNINKNINFQSINQLKNFDKKLSLTDSNEMDQCISSYANSNLKGSLVISADEVFRPIKTVLAAHQINETSNNIDFIHMDSSSVDLEKLEAKQQIVLEDLNSIKIEEEFVINK